MNYLLFPLIIVSISCAAGHVKDDKCKVAISGTGIELMDEMHESMKIDMNSIEEEKTRTELIYNEPVDAVLARQYAAESYKKSPEKWLSAKDYMDTYTDYNPRNLIIKFIFKNKEGKEDIFLVSAITNDYECNVRFNGYIIVKREF